MKIDREKLVILAITSKCTICGERIGYHMWECSEKNGIKNFVHIKCLDMKKGGN